MDVIWDIFGPIILTIVTPFILLLAKRALRLTEQKLGIELSAHERALFEELARKGAIHAEEVARRTRKDESDGGTGLSGREKLEKALEFVETEAGHTGIRVDNERARRMIEVKLAEDRQSKMN